MSSLNKVFLMGNLTRDPEIRTFAGGGQVCAFGMAVNRRYRTSQGEDREEVCFVDIDVFGRQAESVSNYLSKGSPALVEGRLHLDQWEDRQTGQKRSRLKVMAERVQFMGSPRGEFGNDQNAPQQSQNQGAQRAGGGRTVNEAAGPYDGNDYESDYNAPPASAPARRTQPAPDYNQPPAMQNNNSPSHNEDIDDIPF